MKNPNEITITITIPQENGVFHTHSAHLPLDDEHEVMANDCLNEFIELLYNIFGEIDTENAIQEVCSKYSVNK